MYAFVDHDNQLFERKVLDNLLYNNFTPKWDQGYKLPSVKFWPFEYWLFGNKSGNFYISQMILQCIRFSVIRETT